MEEVLEFLPAYFCQRPIFSISVSIYTLVEARSTNPAFCPTSVTEIRHGLLGSIAKGIEKIFSAVSILRTLLVATFLTAKMLSAFTKLRPLFKYSNALLT